MPSKLPSAIRSSVRERAENLCEYCHTDERWQMVQFTVDHVVPYAEGGTDDLENLALACFHCNRRKSNKVHVLHPITGYPVYLFDPRKMRWNEHFGWSEDKLKIVPKTDTGQATVDLLHLNRDRVLQIRQDDKLVNCHPPLTDL